jgi:hypothetical protein
MSRPCQAALRQAARRSRLPQGIARPGLITRSALEGECKQVTGVTEVINAIEIK